MQNLDPETVLVIHPMAIGDVVLGTPVSKALKRLYPNAKVIYFTHKSLVPLLQLCDSIDEYMEWTRKAPILAQLAMIKRVKADLLVDLTSSTRTRLLCFLSGIPFVRYHKQGRSEKPVMHVTDRYLAALSTLTVPTAGETNAASVFPTLEPSAQLSDRARELLLPLRAKAPLVAMIPGVGSLRPNRAWPAKRWIELAIELTEQHTASLMLIGGSDDEQLCKQIEDALVQANRQPCINLCGKLSLPETAAALKLAELAISGDTGPCHIAVAVGTPVISMMGPTLQERSGPYACRTIGFSVSDVCQCTHAKKCLVTGYLGAGKCMEQVTAASVFERTSHILASRLHSC